MNIFKEWEKWRAKELGAQLVDINTALVASPLVLLVVMKMKGGVPPWLQSSLLTFASVGITLVVARGIADVGHTALTLSFKEKFLAKSILLLSWAGLSLLLVAAHTVAFVIVSSKQEYLVVIQPAYMTKNLPNFLACFAFSIMVDTTILAVMYSDVVKRGQKDEEWRMETEEDRDRAIRDRNAAQMECHRLREVEKRLQEVEKENEAMRKENEARELQEQLEAIERGM